MLIYLKSLSIKLVHIQNIRILTAHGAQHITLFSHLVKVAIIYSNKRSINSFSIQNFTVKD